MSSGLSNHFIDKIMYSVSSWYKGTYSSDNFPKHLKPPYSIILNLSRSNQLGSHFIAIIEKENEIIYFDPFGLECFVQSLDVNIKRN